MKRRAIGKSTLQTSPIGLGALHFGTYLNEANSIRLIDHANAVGINMIDTGPLYGNGQAETIVGKAIKGNRDQFILTTKVGLCRRTLPDGSFGVKLTPLREKEIRRSLEDSLLKLGTDYVDLFQFHAFDEETPLDHSFEIMDKLVSEGKIRAVGASNYDPIQLARVVSLTTKNSWSPLASLETHYNMIERKAEEGLCMQCRNHSIGLIPYRALARGILTGKYKAGEDIPKNSRGADSWRVSRWLTDGTLSLTGALAKYSQAKGFTLAQLSVAWLLTKKEIPLVLIGARNLSQLDDILKCSQLDLRDDDLKKIDKIINQQGQSETVASLPLTFFET